MEQPQQDGHSEAPSIRGSQLVGWTLLAVLILSVGCCGTVGPSLLLVPFELAVGWLLFLVRIAPEGVNLAAIAVLAVYLIASLTGFVTLASRLTFKGANENGMASDRGRRCRLRGLAMAGTLALLFIAGVSLMGVAHQTTWMATSKESMFQGWSNDLRSHTTNQLRQLGQGARSHHGVYKRLPPGGVFDQHGNGLHGFQLYLLPFLDGGSVFALVDLNLPWNDPKNVPVFQKRIYHYLSPYAEWDKNPEGFALSHYAGNVHVFNAGPGLRVPFDFKDGISNTILMGEATGNFKPWGHPANWRDPGQGVQIGPDGFGNPHNPKGALFVFGDASVRFLKKEASPAALRALATPNGGEKVPEDWDR